MRHIIPISGKDSLTTALVQKKLSPSLPYEYMFNPTGMELPETIEWINRVEKYLESPISRVGDNLLDIIYEQGILPSHNARYCTRLSKIFPMEEWIGESNATVYYGIRADETRIGYQSLSKKNIIPVYPLKQVGYTLPMVWNFVSSIDLMPPAFFWSSLYDMVVEKLGFRKHMLYHLKPWEKAVLFSWRSRPNCYNCFYQRLYEFVGLLEYHPELFWQVDETEKDIGGKNFFYKQNWPLSRIAEKSEEIKRKRCIAVCETIQQIAKDRSNKPEELREDDMLSLVSCGLFCGK